MRHYEKVVQFDDYGGLPEPAPTFIIMASPGIKDNCLWEEIEKSAQMFRHHEAENLEPLSINGIKWSNVPDEHGIKWSNIPDEHGIKIGAMRHEDGRLIVCIAYSQELT